MLFSTIAVSGSPAILLHHPRHLGRRHDVHWLHATLTRAYIRFTEHTYSSPLEQ